MTEEQKTVSVLPGVNILLMGPAGTGKTFSLGTIPATGIETFYLGLEPGLESLLAYFTDHNRPIPENLHWHTMEPQSAGLADMVDAATKINTLSYEGLCKLSDSKRSKYNQFIELLKILQNFPCDRTGKKFGAVDSWGTDKLLAIDGLYGLGRATMSLVIGGKPTRSQSEWGIAQDQIERLVFHLTAICPCHFVLLSHVERQVDEVLGGVKLMLSTLGKALAPKLPPMFSDVILTVRNGDNFTWDTGSPLADVKTRNLAIKKDLKQDFALIINKWKSRNKS